MDGQYFSLTTSSSRVPPTAFLPRLARFQEHSALDVALAVQRLQDLYRSSKIIFPPASSALGLPKYMLLRFPCDGSLPDSGYASAEDEDEDEDELTAQGDNQDLEILRADPFERAFAIKWVTGFISRSDMWIALSTSDEENHVRSKLLDEVTSLLSTLGMDNETDHEEKGGLTRSFSFPSAGGMIDVELNDEALSDEDHTSVGLQSWGSAIVLAQKIAADPARFFLHLGDRDESRPLRVLELGAGTGMLSIVTAKILHRAFPPPIIIATDYHPDVMTNLSANIRTNFPTGMYGQLSVSVHTLDWEDPVYLTPLDERFDLVLAADVIYHPEHARLIRGCAERVLSRTGTFWMIMALRTSGRHEGLDATVEEMFPDVSVVGQRGLVVLDRMVVKRLQGVGRVDENDYRLFKIGWKDCGAAVAL